jgi:predicted amidophosphoribosyltransferase
MSLLSGLASLIFPPLCLSCGGDLTNGQSVLCLRCQRALNEKSHQGIINGVPFYTRLTYGLEISQLVLLAKEENNRTARNYLARRLAYALSDSGKEIGARIILMPAPSTRAATRVRGFEHCLLLARSMRRELTHISGSERRVGADIAIVQPLKVTRALQDQSLLNPAQRMANLDGAYSFDENFRALLEGAGVRHRGGAARRPYLVLVDDVMTSGATMGEGIRVLRSAGFEPDMAILACVSPRLISQ